MSHARLSPSAASRWMACPGSVSFTAGMYSPSGAAAIDGTHAHSLLEVCLQQNLAPLTFIGQVFEDKVIDQEKAEAVQIAYDYVLMRWAEVSGKMRMYPEMRVNPDSMGRTDIMGTADIIMVTDNWIEVVDYKHGRGVIVEPHNNRQMQIYGIGAMDTLDLQIAGKELITTIIQPRAPHDMGPIRSARYTPSDVQKFTTEIMVAAAATDDPNALCIPGESQCRWCLGKATCSALASQSLGVTGSTVALVDTTSAMIQQNALRDPKEMTPEQVTMVLENHDLVMGWLKAVKETALATLIAGGDVPGFKLTAGRKSRKWNMPEEDLSAMLRSIKRVGGGKVKLEEIYSSTMKSPSAIEKLLGSSVTKAALKKVKAAYSTSDGAPQLTPASSSKAALPSKATDVFEDLTPPEQQFQDLTVPSFLS